MGVPLTGTITQYPNGAYPTHNAATGADGWRSVNSFTDRNAIPSYYRNQGMAVWVYAANNSNGALYTLNAPPWNNTNSDWTAFSGGGGGNTNGTVTSFAFTNSNGLNGSVATNTTTPNLTLSTSVNGLVQGNGTAFSAVSLNGLNLTNGTLSTNTSGTRDFTFAIPNTITPTNGTNIPGYYLTCTHNGTFTNWYTSAVNAPTGNSIVYDVFIQINGSGNFASLWASNTNNRPAIAVNATINTNTAFDTATYNAGDRLRFDVVQIDGANTAAGLTLTIGSTVK